MLLTRIPASALLASLCLSPAYAAPTESLDPVVVTASRTAQSIDEALAPVIIISRDEIERSLASDVAGLLRFHAGLDIARTGGPGAQTSLFIRGTESNHALVMIDGVKVNPGTIGVAALQNIAPELIERIEIVKGPRSTLYGSDAIGGVVHIITRKQKQDGTKIATTLGFGDDHDRRFSASLLHKEGNYRAGLSFSRQGTEGIPALVTQDNDRGYNNRSINAYAGYSFANGTDIEFSHWQATGTSEYDSFGSAVDQDFTNLASSLTVKNNLSDNWASTLKLSHFKDQLNQNQNANYIRTKRNVLDWQNDIELNNHNLVTAGVMFSREDTVTVGFTSFDEDTDVNALFIQDNITWGNHQVLAGARYIDHSDFGTHTTWNLEYGYQFTPKLRMTAGVGTAFRAPDSTDRYGFGGDPDLDPEVARNTEIGLRYKIDSHQNVSVNVFDNKIDDLIGFTTMAVNINEARIRGVEVAYNYAKGPWSFRTEAISQDPEDRSNDEILARRAERSLTASLDYSRGRHQLGLDLLTTSKRENSSFDTTVLDSYTLVNLRGGVKLDQDWTIQARVENLFDEEYATASTSSGDYSVQDRAFRFELRYSPK